MAPGSSPGFSGREVAAIILAFFVPPLSVFLVDGLHASFWINILLWILGWIPGVIHALYVIYEKHKTTRVTPVTPAVGTARTNTGVANANTTGSSPPASTSTSTYPSYSSYPADTKNPPVS